MKKTIITLLLAISPFSFAQSNPQASNTMADLRTRCPKELPNQEIVFSDDFRWNMSLKEVLEASSKIYASGKRLEKRAYFDEATQSLWLPNGDFQGGNVELPLSFIATVQLHIEKALENRYVDAVIFPDMGHSHYLIPLEKYDKTYKDLPVTETSKMYTLFFKDPELKVVYHTAEQLHTMKNNTDLQDDPYLQWRHFTRNLIGENFGARNVHVAYAKDQSSANTLGEVNGYFWWGAGFNLSANKDGCFQYLNKRDGKVYNFDISLHDLHPNPANSSGSGASDETPL